MRGRLLFLKEREGVQDMGKPVSAKTAAARMAKAYGKSYRYTCSSCCNCQKTSYAERACIAYSDHLAWNEFEKACGLYNRPFYGMKPQLKQLGRVYGEDREQPQDDCEQFGFF